MNILYSNDVYSFGIAEQEDSEFVFNILAKEIVGRTGTASDRRTKKMDLEARIRKGIRESSVVLLKKGDTFIASAIFSGSVKIYVVHLVVDKFRRNTSDVHIFLHYILNGLYKDKNIYSINIPDNIKSLFEFNDNEYKIKDSISKAANRRYGSSWVT